MDLKQFFQQIHEEQTQSPYFRLVQDIKEFLDSHPDYHEFQFYISQAIAGLDIELSYDGNRHSVGGWGGLYNQIDTEEKYQVILQSLRDTIEAKTIAILEKPTFRQWVDKFYQDFPAIRELCVEQAEQHTLWFDTKGDFSKTKSVQWQDNIYGSGQRGGEYTNPYCNPYAYSYQEAVEIAAKLADADRLIKQKKKRDSLAAKGVKLKNN